MSQSSELAPLGWVDIHNSSTKLLLANATWTGKWTEVLEVSSIVVAVKVVEGSAINGLHIEHSSDGINVDGDDEFTIADNAGKVFTFMPNTKYYRVQYHNGSSDQTVFRLQSILKIHMIIHSSHRVQDSIVEEDDATLVKSIVTGQDVESGNFDNVKTFEGALNIKDVSSLPPTFTKQTSNGRLQPIQKGQLNTVRLRPQILNEHQESNRNVQSVVSSGNIVGQIFKASQDNINGINLVLESAAGATIDDFESYADSTALRVVWVEGTNPATLETTIIKDGTQAMKMSGAILADQWVNTVAPIDYTEYTGEFDFYVTALTVIFEVFIGDGVNTKSAIIAMTDPNSWQHVEVNESAMSEDGGGTTDVTAITKIGFRISTKKVATFGYIDNLEATPPPGSIELKLWDFGATIPTSAVDGLNDATQYMRLGDEGFNSISASKTVFLEGGKKIYNVTSFVAGVALEIPTNELLIVDNYYAITIHYIDTDVSVYGANPAFLVNYYVNGYAFTTPDAVSVITMIGAFNDIMFHVHSTAEVYINTLVKFLNAAPGTGASESIYIEDKNMEIVTSIVGTFIPLQEVQAEFTRAYPYFPKGGKFEINYNDDFTDSVAIMGIFVGYFYEPPTVHG